MALQLLPNDFDQAVRDAVRLFWSSRLKGSTTQAGTRGQVIGGKNLDGFLSIVRSVAKHCGLPDSSVYTNGRQNLTLPDLSTPTPVGWTLFSAGLALGALIPLVAAPPTVHLNRHR